MQTHAIRITSFGQGRFEVPSLTGPTTVQDLLNRYGVETAGRRVAVNGHPTREGANVLEGDEVTVVPKVRAG